MMNQDKRNRVTRAILAHAKQLASIQWCSVCHSLDPLGPLSRKRRVRLRSPLGYRMSAAMTDFDVRGQWGHGRVALLDRTFEELKESAAKGCACCDLIQRILSKLQLRGEEINIWLEQHQAPKVTVWVNEGQRAYIELFITEDDRQDWGLFYKLQPVASHAGAVGSNDFLKSCLHRCTTHHDTCRVTPNHMPARLVEVVHDGNRCRLTDGTKLSPQPYVALSYRWGDRNAQSLKTTRETLIKCMTYISQDELPKAIRDAAFLTNMIGVNYLWIDALCIVQDDPSDWESHVAMMGEIYQNAHLVIAAGSSKHSDYSFLHVPNRPITHSVPFNYKGQSGLVCFKMLQGIGMHENYESMYGGLDPLDERAWALQERVLATRLVIYSSTELQWICRGLRTCEAVHPENQRENLVIQDNTDPLELYSLWHRLVKDYSKRRLTFASDKLPAIAGLAANIALITKSEYSAGLWKTNLIHDMCWERHLWESLPWTAPAKWRAPSFSWASVDGNIFYNDESIAGRKGTCLTEILESSCTASSLTSPLGEVKDGFVKLQGPIRKARIYTHPNAKPGFNWTHVLHFIDSFGTLPFRSDVPLTRNPLEQTSQSQDGKDGPQYTANRAFPGGEAPLNGECAWALVVGYWYEHYSYRDETDMWISCIVLGKVGKDSNTYQRLGFVNTHWPPWRSKFGDPEFNDLVPFMYEAEKTEIIIV